MSDLPSLKHPTRRRPLLVLLVAGLLRGVLAFVAVLLFTRLSAGGIALSHFITALLTLAAALGGLRALETVQAERLGQAYVHSLRKRLVKRLSDPDAPPRGRGGQWLRMTADLNGLRRWISQGLGRSVAAGAMLSSLCVALLFTRPWLAGLVLLVLAVSGLLMWALRARLLDRERSLRRARARLANAVERQMSSPRRDVCADVGRGERRVARRSREVWTASVARTQIHAGLRAWTEAAPMAVMAASVALSALTGGHAGLLPALALVGLLTPSLRDLGLAWEMRQSHEVAATNVMRLLAPPSPSESAAASAARGSSVPATVQTQGGQRHAPGSIASLRMRTPA